MKFCTTLTCLRFVQLHYDYTCFLKTIDDEFVCIYCDIVIVDNNEPVDKHIETYKSG